MNSLKCIIVDDEPFARKGLEKYVSKIPFLALAGATGTIAKARRLMEMEQIDLIYLDINLPKVSGIDFLKSLSNPPQVIFTTAYPEYAIEGFELDVTDYLLKPITYERFLKASEKALTKMQQSAKEMPVVNMLPEDDYFFIKTKGKLEKIKKKEILFIQGMGNYVTIHTKDKKIVTYASLKDIETKLQTLNLLTIHKSYRVPINHIESYDGKFVLLQSHSLPVSRSYKEGVVANLNSKKLSK